MRCRIWAAPDGAALLFWVCDCAGELVPMQSSYQVVALCGHLIYPTRIVQLGERAPEVSKMLSRDRSRSVAHSLQCSN